MRFSAKDAKTEARFTETLQFDIAVAAYLANAEVRIS
jgi:hypothetical protein